ncbi:MAG: pyridoxamine 5'-phosphate oxidase [Acidobacteriota bacterium]
MTELNNINNEPSLRRKDLAASPFAQFDKWYKEAQNTEHKFANAMTLATATRENVPSARVVLLKDFDEEGFVFFTNYDSQKGDELAENPIACLNFYWEQLDRQVRITGRVTKTSREESEEYFRTRPLESRLGAWASKQSRVIESRAVLENEMQQLKEKYADGEVPLPAYWGGYRVAAEAIEFWQNRTGRLHDRFRYTRQADGSWLIERLSP